MFYKTDENLVRGILLNIFLYNGDTTKIQRLERKAYIKKEETNATKIANSYLSPTWEVTNTFVVGLVIAICSLFPGAVFPIGEALIVPASLILVLLCIMSAFLVFSHSVDKNEIFSKRGRL
ncbi:cytochrome d ubiquinol oxidase subunit II [Peribacillus simplex]|uniref:cytochrome d ubiquinol oxidase subunit II n=1 Tax=Peribacillus simplex TaxID=1478 RepID=UPI003D29476E